MRVFVDSTEVHAMTARAEVELAALPREMLDVLDVAAQEARSSHVYTNRTGNLEASTYAVPITYGDSEVAIEFAAREEYASYVEARGYSTGVDDAANEAARSIDAMLDLKARIIAGT